MYKENEKLTVGKIFCMKLLVMNFRKAKSGEENLKAVNFFFSFSLCLNLRLKESKN